MATKMKVETTSLEFTAMPSAAAVEQMTSGVFTLDESGHLSGDPAVMMWLAGFKGLGG